MKSCKICKITKNTSEFYKNKSIKDGFSNKCKSCSKQYEKNNAERIKLRKAQWYKNNTQAVAQQYKDNAEKRRQQIAQWSKNNVDKRNAITAKRKAAKLERTVPWANLDAICALYTEAQRLTKETGIPHHVDHIIPLQGKLVSGLHIETNLQVLPFYENLSKSNSYTI